MSLLDLLSFASLIAMHNSGASVIKPGKMAPITVNEIFTPFGDAYMKSRYFQLIFPGTKWCGDGDIADNYNDLGTFSETDMCCRTHDFCEDILFKGEMKETLTNTHKFTRLHCKCDLQFHDCLSKIVNDRISAQLIGISYFEILAPKCYAQLPPATCIKHETTLGFNKRCVQYTYDCTKDNCWQWFDVPKWKGFRAGLGFSVQD